MRIKNELDVKGFITYMGEPNPNSSCQSINSGNGDIPWDKISEKDGGSRGWTQREDDVDWNQLFFEFEFAKGSEKILFIGNHPLNKDLSKSYIVFKARQIFFERGKKDLIAEDISFSLLNVPLMQFL